MLRRLYGFQLPQRVSHFTRIKQIKQSSSTGPSSRKSRFTPKKLTPPYNFHQKAVEVVSRVKVALEPMVALNDGFKISHSPDKLVVDTAKGKYIFTVDLEVEKLIVQSPISGSFQYDYDNESEQWLSSQDSHDMRGLITRDLLRHCRGLPTF